MRCSSLGKFLRRFTVNRVADSTRWKQHVRIVGRDAAVANERNQRLMPPHNFPPAATSNHFGPEAANQSAWRTSVATTRS